MKRVLAYLLFIGSITMGFSQQQACYGTSLKYSVDDADGPTGTSGSQYTWSILEAGFTGSLSPTANSVTVDWSTPPGNYTLTVQEENTGCVGALVTETIMVYERPVVNFSDADDTICAGNSLTVTAVVDPVDFGGDYTYVWTVPSGATDPGDVSSFTASIAGQYSVEVTNIALSCSSMSSAKMLTVVPLPTVSVAPLGPMDICDGQSVTLNATASAGVTFQWSNSSGAIAGETNSSLSVTQTSDYYVTVTNADGCTANSNIVKVNVNPLPSVSISPSGSTTICVGDTVGLTATADVGTSLQWYNASGAIAGETGNTLNVDQASDYYVTATDANGCENTSNSITVVLNPLPSVSIVASGSTTICQGESVVLTATADPGTSLQWSNGSGAIIGETSNTLQVTGTDDYYVTAVNSNGCEDNSNTVGVTVNPIPVTSAINHN